MRVATSLRPLTNCCSRQLFTIGSRIPLTRQLRSLGIIINNVQQTRKMSSKGAANDDLKMAKLYDVSGYIAVVSGGGTGIGLMITQALIANGASKVYITGRRQEVLETVVKEYSEQGADQGKIIAVPCDISSKVEVKRIADEIAAKEPKGISLLVNNAGVAHDDNTKYSNSKPDMKSAQAISDHMWKSEPITNVTAHYFMSAAFLPLLAKGREESPGISTSIVNICSISGVMSGSSNGQFSYAASKAGVFPSEMTAGDSDEKNKSELGKLSNPAKRAGSDQDMAAAILYLAGPGGVFLNAQVIYPDGGNLLTEPSI